MSDNSSMIIVVLIGGVMSCGMVCIGGLAAWYLKDPTLGGLLGSASASAAATDSTAATSTSTSASASAAASTTIPTTSKTFIYTTGCTSSLLAATWKPINKPPVGMHCDNSVEATWKLQKAGDPKSKTAYYYVQHFPENTDPSANKGYLRHVSKGGALDITAMPTNNAEKHKCQWEVKPNGDDGSFSFKNRSTGYYLSVNPKDNCKWQAAGTTGNLYMKDSSAVDSKWKFTADYASTGATNGDNKCGN